MFKKICLILLILFCVNIQLGYALELEPRVNFMVYDSQEIRAGTALELRIHHKGLFVAIEQENFRYHAMDMDLKSLGVGAKTEIWPDLFLWLKVAYYMPSEDGRMPWEAGYNFMNRQWAWLYGATSFDNYEVVLDKAFGGSIGLDYNKRIYEDIYLGIGAAYRYMRINERYNAWDNGGAPGVTGWLYEREGDFSAFVGTLFVRIEF